MLFNARLYVLVQFIVNTYAPVCWCHILCPHGTEDEAIKPLIEAEVANKAFAHQLSASASLRITVTQLPHGQRTRKLHLWGLCSFF